MKDENVVKLTLTRSGTVTQFSHALIEKLWFDEIWHNFKTDPSKLHNLVWYNLIYHFEQRLDIPPQPDAGATTISQA